MEKNISSGHQTLAVRYVTVLHSASQRSFLRVNLYGRSPKGPRSAANCLFTKDT